MLLGRKHLLTTGVALATLLAALQEGAFAPTAYSSIAMLLWFAVLTGLAVGLMPRDLLPRTALAALGLLLGLAALFGLSMSWSVADERAFEGAVRVLGYAGLFALVIIGSRRGEARQWLYGLAIGLTAVAAVALATRIAPGLGGDEALVRLIPSALGRLSFPIGYWNGLAALMAICVTLLAWIAAQGPTQLARAVAMGLAPLPALVIYLGSSRGGVAAALAGLIVLFALSEHRTRFLVATLLIGGGTAALVAFASSLDQLLDGASGSAAADQGIELLAAIAGVAALLFVLTMLIDGPLRSLSVPRWLGGPAIAAGILAVLVLVLAAGPADRWEEFKQPPQQPEETDNFIASHLTSGSGSGRYQFWSVAFDAFEKEPVRGIGAGSYETFWTQEAPFNYSLQNAHSLFLETLAELGLIGGLLLFGFFGICLVEGLRRLRHRDAAICVAVIAAGLVSAAIDWTWQLPAVFFPVILACALAAGPALRVGEADERGVRQDRRRAELALRGGGILTALLAFLVAAVLLLGSSKLEESRDAAARGDLAAALKAADDASALQPWAAAPRLQEGLLLERLGRIEKALQAVKEALDRGPDDWRTYLVLSRLELRTGDGEAALRSLREAKALNPLTPLLNR